MINPITLLTTWLSEEKQRGAPDPQLAVLSTANKDAIPHGRVVAIREIDDDGLLFFTGKSTRKSQEISSNRYVSLTFWFELFDREVMIDGMAHPLSVVENHKYWEALPTYTQIRFYSYAPTSTKVILGKQVLEEKRKALVEQYQDKPIPMSEYYCGYRILPQRMVFYSYRTDEFSDVFEYRLINGQWELERLSP